QVAGSAWEAMDSGLSIPTLEIQSLDGFDPETAEARGFPPPVVVLLPRRGRTIAALAAAREDPVGEAELRLVYGAANQLVLHLDRILVARESEQGRFRTILDSLPQAVVVTDGTLRVVLANAAGSRLLAALPAGAGPLPPLGELDLAPLVRALADTPEGRTAEARLPDGRLLSLSLARAFDAHVVLVAADVTEDRRLQERLAQSEKLSSLGQMISGIAHELNNPLASVLGFTQLMARQAGE